jgi:D-3-phosphoglycerate dehydrogenase / 2-oxoglutarate reductase
MKVVIPQDITDAGKAYLKEKGYELIIGKGDTEQGALKELLADADALLARTAVYSEDTLRSAKKLKVIGRHGIGIDNLPVEYCKANNIPIFITPYANAGSVAEHTIGLIIACMHSVPYCHKGVCNGEWGFRNSLGAVDLAGKVLGVIGMGRIGSLVAKKAMAGFDMKVIGYDAYISGDKFLEGVECVDSIEEIFKRADVVTLHAPATADTKDCVNKKTLSLMKPSAYLINCARGELVVEEDLYEALKEKTIRGAAVDVLRKEPPGKENPLFTLENFIITPHSAALTKESMDRMGLHAAMGIDAVLSGKYKGETDALYKAI